MSAVIREAWFKWKAMRLPWRKRFLIGHDLSGNTFWEFRDVRGAGPGRYRRIVQYPSNTHHSDVKVSPQWHQWLRYTREHPPSITEQSQDLVRQDRMKILAAQADARWEAKPRVMDAPGQPNGQRLPTLDTAKTQPIAPETTSVNKDASAQPSEQPGETVAKKYGHDPWSKPRGGPSEEWQPQAWSPPASKRK